jgi:prepilin-type processing-associated H-X9-DG protein
MSQNLYGLALAQFTKPADCIILGDSCHPMGADWRMAWPEAQTAIPSNPCGIMGDTALQDSATVHNLGSNVAYADGHAKWMRGDTIYSGGSGQYFTP